MLLDPSGLEFCLQGEGTVIAQAGKRHDTRPRGRMVRPPARPRRAAKSHERPRARAHGLVLIVDDTADTREMYSQYLTSRGFTVLTARDGAFGVDMARRRRPDVIVMDLAMPNVDGITATQRLKADLETRRMPILILTGYPMQAIDQGALEAGADVFLTKPCLPEDLEQHVQRLIERAA